MPCAQLTRGIEKTVAGLVEELQQLSVEVRDEDLANVATVSAGGNEVVSFLPAVYTPLSYPPVLHVFCFAACVPCACGSAFLFFFLLFCSALYLVSSCSASPLLLPSKRPDNACWQPWPFFSFSKWRVG